MVKELAGGNVGSGHHPFAAGTHPSHKQLFQFTGGTRIYRPWESAAVVDYIL